MSTSCKPLPEDKPCVCSHCTSERLAELSTPLERALQAARAAVATPPATQSCATPFVESVVSPTPTSTPGTHAPVFPQKTCRPATEKQLGGSPRILAISPTSAYTSAKDPPVSPQPLSSPKPKQPLVGSPEQQAVTPTPDSVLDSLFPEPRRGTPPPAAASVSRQSPPAYEDEHPLTEDSAANTEPERPGSEYMPSASDDHVSPSPIPTSSSPTPRSNSIGSPRRTRRSTPRGPPTDLEPSKSTSRPLRPSSFEGWEPSASIPNTGGPSASSGSSKSPPPMRRRRSSTADRPSRDVEFGKNGSHTIRRSTKYLDTQPVYRSDTHTRMQISPTGEVANQLDSACESSLEEMMGGSDSGMESSPGSQSGEGVQPQRIGLRKRMQPVRLSDVPPEQWGSQAMKVGSRKRREPKRTVPRLSQVSPNERDSHNAFTPEAVVQFPKEDSSESDVVTRRARNRSRKKRSVQRRPRFDIDADDEEDYPSITESSPSESEAPDFRIDADDEDWCAEEGAENSRSDRSGCEGTEGNSASPNKQISSCGEIHEHVMTRSAGRRAQRPDAKRFMQSDIPVIVIDDSTDEGAAPVVSEDVYVISDSEPQVESAQQATREGQDEHEGCTAGRKSRKNRSLADERKLFLEKAMKVYKSLFKRQSYRIACMSVRHRGVLYSLAERVGARIVISKKKRYLKHPCLKMEKKKFQELAEEAIGEELCLPRALEVAKQLEGEGNGDAGKGTEHNLVKSSATKKKKQRAGDQGENAHNFVKSFAGRAQVASSEIEKLVRDGKWDKLGKLFNGKRRR